MVKKVRFRMYDLEPNWNYESTKIKSTCI